MIPYQKDNQKKPCKSVKINHGKFITEEEINSKWKSIGIIIKIITVKANIDEEYYISNMDKYTVINKLFDSKDSQDSDSSNKTTSLNVIIIHDS